MSRQDRASSPIPAAERQQLDQQGYLVLRGAFSRDLRQRLAQRMEELFSLEGDAAGSEFKQEAGARRLANLVDKDPVFASCIDRPELLPYVAAVIPERFKLSSLNARSANPENRLDQPLHADGGSLPDERGFWVCNLLFMLDDFRSDNGALRLVPATHRSGKLPAEALADPLLPHPEQVLVTGQIGDVLVLNGHLWHGGLANSSAEHRRALHAYYCRWDKPQQQYQKRLLRPEVQRSLTPTQRELCALDDLDNDRVSAADGGRSGFLK